MVRKALFILLAIALPLSAIGFATHWLVRGLGWQGACFLLPLAGLYLGAMLVLFEAQRRRSQGDRPSDDAE
jgi:hypothetical protein